MTQVAASRPIFQMAPPQVLERAYDDSAEVLELIGRGAPYKSITAVQKEPEGTPAAPWFRNFWALGGKVIPIGCEDQTGAVRGNGATATLDYRPGPGVHVALPRAGGLAHRVGSARGSAGGARARDGTESEAHTRARGVVSHCAGWSKQAGATRKVREIWPS